MKFDWTQRALAEGLRLYQEGEFFAAHEAWESVWLESQERPIPAGNPGELTVLCRHRTGPLAAHAKGCGNVLLRLFLRAFPEPEPIPKNDVIGSQDVAWRNKEGRSHVKI